MIGKPERYRSCIQGKKWYFCLISHTFDVAVVNTTILYNLANPQSKLDLLDVRRYIVKCLLKKNVERGKKRVFSKTIPKEVRQSDGHFIERTEGKDRKYY